MQGEYIYIYTYVVDFMAYQHSSIKICQIIMTQRLKRTIHTHKRTIHTCTMYVHTAIETHTFLVQLDYKTGFLHNNYVITFNGCSLHIHLYTYTLTVMPIRSARSRRSDAVCSLLGVRVASLPLSDTVRRGCTVDSTDCKSFVTTVFSEWPYRNVKHVAI